MDLEQFIKDALVGIRKGVAAANDALGDKNRTFSLTSGREKESFINFDIAVTAVHASNTSGGGGIHVQVVDIGGSKEIKSAQETASRIKFAVSIDWFSN